MITAKDVEWGDHSRNGSCTKLLFIYRDKPLQIQLSGVVSEEKLKEEALKELNKR